MWMRLPTTISLTVFLLFGAVTTTAASPRGPAVAVFPIQLVEVPELDDVNTDKFLDLLEAVVIAQNYPTVPRSDIKAAIAETSADSFKQCYDESCQIELGKAVAASKALYSSFARFGRRCRLIIKLYDLQTALAEASSSQTATCDEEGLAQAIEAAQSELGQNKATTNQSAPPPPAPSAPPPPLPPAERPEPPPPAKAAADQQALPLAEAPSSAEDEDQSDGSIWWILLGVGVMIAGGVVVGVLLLGDDDDGDDPTSLANSRLGPGFRF